MKNINPILIIIAGILISFTIVYKDRQNSFKIKSNNFDNLKKANFIESDDIVIGNKDANFFLIEYIDLQCKHCKDFHPHLHSLINSKYVTSGEIAVVIRHGPHIDQLSTEKGLTTECIRTNYGNQKTLDFINKSLLVVNEAEYPTNRFNKIFDELNIESEKISECRALDGNKRASFEEKTKRIVKSLQITQTPYLQILDNNGTELYSEFGVHTFQELTEIFYQIIL